MNAHTLTASLLAEALTGIRQSVARPRAFTKAEAERIANSGCGSNREAIRDDNNPELWNVAFLDDQGSIVDWVR